MSDVHRSEDRLHCTLREYFFLSNGNTNLGWFSVDFLEPGKGESWALFTHYKLKAKETLDPEVPGTSLSLLLSLPSLLSFLPSLLFFISQLA